MKSRRNCMVIKRRENSAMGRLTKIFGFIASFAMTAICWSCNTNGCTDNRSSIPLAGFYSTEGKAIVLDSLNIGGIGAPNDSLLLVAGTSASEVYLPLRSELEEVKYFIAYRYKALNYPQLIDSITFRYNSIPYFASEECGAMMRYRITSIGHTRHLLDSVAIVPTDSIITNADVENLRLYFKTSTTEN